ncbi:MAG: hypothetical protein AB7U73_21890 [Pirellulales bacterium]
MPSFTATFNSQGVITLPEITRAQQVQEPLVSYPIPWYAWRVHDAPQTNLPGTSASDDLGVYGTAFGTNSPSVRTYDVKNAGAVSLYARTFLCLPPEYDPAESVTLRFYCGMITTVASTSATVDCACYESDNAGGIGADLVTTSAQDINNLTPANKDFTVTPTNLAPGDILDLRVVLAISDTGTGTAVIGMIGAAFLLLDIRG